MSVGPRSAASPVFHRHLIARPPGGTTAGLARLTDAGSFPKGRGRRVVFGRARGSSAPLESWMDVWHKTRRWTRFGLSSPSSHCRCCTGCCAYWAGNQAARLTYVPEGGVLLATAGFNGKLSQGTYSR